jgi:hypothetical protein
MLSEIATVLMRAVPWPPRKIAPKSQIRWDLTMVDLALSYKANSYITFHVCSPMGGVFSSRMYFQGGEE